MNKLFSVDELIKGGNSKYVISTAIKMNGFLKLTLKRFAKKEIEGRFQRAINRANARIAVDLKSALDEAILSDVWPSLRGNVDIYDTGELMQSGVVTFDENGLTIAYRAPYANLVHYGGYINPYGRMEISIYLPPRPWVDSVVKGSGFVPAFKFNRYYLEELRKEFRR